MKKYLVFTSVLCLVVSVSVHAKDIEMDPVNFGLLSQNDFEDFITELGTAVSFVPMTPAEPLGITGLDVALEVAVTDINHSQNYWKYMVEDNDPMDLLPVARIHVQKGLPMNIDIGGMYAMLPDSNIEAWGLEVKWAMIKGGVLMPAASVRGSYTRLIGVDDVGLRTYGADLLVSKGFLMFTPYGGISAMRVDGSDESGLPTGFSDVNEDVVRWLAGLQFSLFPFLIINGEVVFGEVDQYGLKAGIRF